MKAVDAPLLEVRDLSISFETDGKYLHAVNRVSLNVGRGEIVGLIGQSGSGKTTLVMGLLGLLRGSPGVWRGEVLLGEWRLLPPCPEYAIRKPGGKIRKRSAAFFSAQEHLLKDLRGREIAAIFQEPRAALDPYFKVGEHMLEALRRSAVSGTAEELRARGVELLQDVGLVDAAQLWGLHPHQISGGMAQRVMIAMALCAKPSLLVADEPSTALDVTTQAKLLELFQRLRDKHGLSILLISHDIGVIQEVCRRVYVMHRGAVVESGETAGVLTRFKHPYTGSLMQAFSHFGRHSDPGVQPPLDPEAEPGCAYRSMCPAYGALSGAEKRRCEEDKPALQGNDSGGAPMASEWARCHFPGLSKSLPILPESKNPVRAEDERPAAPLVEIRQIRKCFRRDGSAFQALDGVSLILREGETYALVGESGSGKSTLALSMMALQDADGGEILYKGEDLLKADKTRMRKLRREIRMLFQHPEAVLNGGMTVTAILSEGLEKEHELGREEILRRVSESLEQVHLEPGHAHRFPGNLSSGEKQRVTIARALITRPRLLVCDEPVASLDLAIQSQIMELLREFQGRLGLTYLFISHNLELVKLLAHRIGVMYMGRLVEEASAEGFTVGQARHPYTRLLLASVPSMGDENLRSICAEFPDVEPVRLENGCPFRNRCPLYLENHHAECETAMPPLRDTSDGGRVACHLARA